MSRHQHHRRCTPSPTPPAPFSRVPALAVSLARISSGTDVCAAAAVTAALPPPAQCSTRRRRHGDPGEEEEAGGEEEGGEEAVASEDQGREMYLPDMHVWVSTVLSHPPVAASCPPPFPPPPPTLPAYLASPHLPPTFTCLPLPPQVLAARQVVEYRCCRPILKVLLGFTDGLPVDEGVTCVAKCVSGCKGIRVLRRVARCE